MNETLFQKEIYTLLSSKGYRVYSDKKYPKIGWFPQTFQGKKKPDLLVFHDFLKFKDVHNRCEKKRLPSPIGIELKLATSCLLYTSPSPRDISGSRMPSSA